MPSKNSTSKKTIKLPRRKPAQPEGSVQGFDRKEFERGLHAFGCEAYEHALDYYSKHHNNPAALNDLQIRNPGPVDPGWVELSNAVRYIATCDFAPATLKESVTQWLCSSASCGILDELMANPAVIQKILVAASCRQEESDAEN